jgi:DNA-binding MurR/RpiR family transcriptional regulator
LPEAAVRAFVDVDLAAKNRVVFGHFRSSFEVAQELENV